MLCAYDMLDINGALDCIINEVKLVHMYTCACLYSHIVWYECQATIHILANFPLWLSLIDFVYFLTFIDVLAATI